MRASSLSTSQLLEQERFRLSNNLGRALRELRGVSSQIDVETPGFAVEPDFHWDALRDTRYAHEFARLDGLLHIFQQEWVGVRAAAGSLPGRKLALKSDAPLPHHVIRKLVREIKAVDPKRIVMQGMSGLMGQLVDEFVAHGLQERLFVVFHGATSQWHSEHEANYAFKCLALAHAGKIRRLHFMKAGFEFPESRLYRPMLFNFSPCLAVKKAELADKVVDDKACIGDIALIPGWSGWRKNIHTNALGAALSPRIKEVQAFGNALTLPPPLGAKLRVMPYINREQTFELIRAATLVMNVSLVDCHPMLNLEAQALDRPCLRGPLFLDALEDHPYVQLTEVKDVSSPAEIRSTVERVLDVDLKERRELIRDYQGASNTLAFERYCEFLEL